MKQKDGFVTEFEDGEYLQPFPALCNVCNKKMLICWETVCINCRQTFCFDHSVVYRGHWHCVACSEIG